MRLGYLFIFSILLFSSCNYRIYTNGHFDNKDKGLTSNCKSTNELDSMNSLAKTKHDKELILYNGIEKKVLKKGKIIGVTLKGEDYKYTNWKNLCRCDTSIIPRLWQIDKIDTDQISLTGYDYQVTFNQKTILRKNLNSLKNMYYNVDTIIHSNTKNPQFDEMICRIINLEKIEEKHLNVRYDSIESFTFANGNKDICNKEFFIIKFSHYHAPQGEAKEDAFILLAFLLADATIISTQAIVKNIETEVHRYNLKKWKIKIE